ncbi:MAG: hypothetical protein ACI86S_000363 [Paracoccaceae bacterium]
MFSELEIAGYSAMAVIAVVSLVFAMVKGRKWENQNPSKLGFMWGYFFILSTLLGNGLLFLAVLFATLGEGRAVLLFAGFVALLVICATKALQRRRWALVLTTLLSFNVVWIIINFSYLRNRWSEFEEERAERLEAEGHAVSSAGDGGMTIVVERGIKKLSKSWRLAIFGAVAWVLAVAVLVFLFEPYGSYMPNDDMVHMLFVMLFMPTSSALGLYWIYERFIG